jgi:hypothetical protein
MNTTTSTQNFGGNREIMLAMQELRRSNATVAKPMKTVRKQRSRAGSKRAAIKEYS